MEHSESLNRAMSRGSIVLIESDSDQARGMETELSQLSYSVVWSNSHLKALSILEDRKDIDLVLVSVEATDISGFDFIHLLRHRNRFEPQCPQVIVIASGESFEKFPLDETGIDDYLLRPYFPGELSWRVGKAIRSRRLRSAPHQADLSTGIYTATGLETVLHEELNKIFRKKAFLSLVMFRFQGLDSIHLNHGRMMIEWMERDLSMAIRNSLRSYDRLGRLEQGRYCLIAPDVDSVNLPLLLERLLQCVQAWNRNVVTHSHIQIPIHLNLRAATIFPDYTPRHLDSAVKNLWNWICQEALTRTFEGEPISKIRLTENGIADISDAKMDVFPDDRLQATEKPLIKDSTT